MNPPRNETARVGARARRRDRETRNAPILVLRRAPVNASAFPDPGPGGWRRLADVVSVRPLVGSIPRATWSPISRYGGRG